MGQDLVRREELTADRVDRNVAALSPGRTVVRVAALALLMLAACKRPQLPPHPSDQTPKIHATIVTIRTILQPANQIITHTVVIADGKARSSDEADRWRLFDFGRKEVTFVDEIAKSSRAESFASLMARHQKEIATPLPEGSPRAQFGPSGARRNIAGVAAAEWVLRIGGYERHLWIGRHPLIPDDLFAMMEASDITPSAMAGLTRPAQEMFLKTPGFPMADRADLHYDKRQMVADRSVTSIEQRDIPLSWLTVPAAYRPAVTTATSPASISTGSSSSQR